MNKLDLEIMVLSLLLFLYTIMLLKFFEYANNILGGL